jgi:uncharacterized membrane protein
MDKSNCPIHNPLIGNDIDFDSALATMGIEPEQKVLVFLSVCIVLRLLIAGLANTYHKKKFVPYLTVVISLFAIFNLSNKINGTQWWSTKFHLVTSVLLLLTSAHQLYTDTRNRNISYLLYTDVLVGLMTFIYVYYSC